jgi:hypothetical protein
MNKYASLNHEQRQNAAIELFGSMRGRYIVGQALALAKAQIAESEPSNAADMELIGLIFEPYYSLANQMPRMMELMKDAEYNLTRRHIQ